VRAFGTGRIDRPPRRSQPTPIKPSARVLVGGRKGRRRHVEEDEKDDDDQDRRRRFEMRVEQQQRFVGFGVERCEMRKKLLLIMSVQSRNDGSFFVVCRVYVEDRE
jgi:hypothetical protein